jgi:FHA domain
VADKRCENGHFIDESWDLCPYCPADSAEAEIPIVRPSRFGGSKDAVPPRHAANDASRSPSIPATAIRSAEGSGAVQAPPMERTIAVARPLDPNMQPKRYVVGWLIGVNGNARGESFAVRMGRNVLGRDRRSDIVVNDDQASSHHADLVFRPEERRYILMDHNSTNGTYVNEEEIEPRRDLVASDLIRIGGHKFLFLPLCREGFYWDDEGALK